LKTICLKTARTFVRCNNFSATKTSRQPRSRLTS
jgi:hypothetical protein